MNALSSIVSVLSSRNVIATWGVRSMGDTKKDQSLSRETAQDHGTDSVSLGVVKRLYMCDQFKALKTFEAQFRLWAKSKTASWGEAQGLLPATRIATVKIALEEKKREYAALVEAFINYVQSPEFQTAEQKRLNGTYKASDYPSASELRAKFDLFMKFAPVPEAFPATLRDQIDEGLREEMENTLQTSLASQATEAKREMLERIADKVAYLSNRIDEISATIAQGKTPKLYKSLTANIAEACAQVKEINFDSDPQIEALAHKIGQMADKIDPDTLRDETARETAKVQAETALAEIQTAMAGFVL